MSELSQGFLGQCLALDVFLLVDITLGLLSQTTDVGVEARLASPLIDTSLHTCSLHRGRALLRFNRSIGPRVFQWIAQLLMDTVAHATSTWTCIPHVSGTLHLSFAGCSTVHAGIESRLTRVVVLLRKASTSHVIAKRALDRSLISGLNPADELLASGRPHHRFLHLMLCLQILQVRKFLESLIGLVDLCGPNVTVLSCWHLHIWLDATDRG